MEKYTTVNRRLEAKPYLFPPSGSNFIFNLRKDLDDLRTGHRFWATPGHPAYAYLFGQPKPVEHNTAYLGAFPSDHPPADSQVLVLKHSQRRHGNPITAVQGPPGSGKTTLALSVCAQQLVERAVMIAEGKPDFSNLTVIASSNNQAVTNVIERLEARYAAKPFWLVGGNRETIDRCALKQLEEMIKHLRDSAPDPLRRGALKRDVLALAAKLRQREESYLRAQASWEQAKSRLAELQRGLPELVTRLEQSTVLAKNLEGETRRLHSYRSLPTDAYRGIKAYLDATWLQLPDDRASWLVRLWCQISGRGDERIFRTLSTKIVDMVAQTADSPFPLSVPTNRSSLAETRHLIEERLQQAADHEASERALTQANNALAACSQQLKVTKQEIAGLEQQTKSQPDDFYSSFHTQDHLDHAQLFDKSREFLEQEALHRKDEVIAALELYVRALGRDRRWDAIRTLESSPDKYLRSLSLVFPIITMALQSVRNMFPFLAPDLIDQIIVDEAGMIPLHCLFPLLVRGRRAIVVGDPMQIEPIALPQQKAMQYFHTGFRDRGLADKDWSLYSPEAVDTATAYHRAAGAGINGTRLGAGIVLREHYRCQAPIAQYCNQICNYDLIVKTTEKDSKLGPRLIAYHVPGRMDGKVNVAEVEAVEAIVGHLLAKGYLATHPKDQDTIGVITPFRPHANDIERRLRARWPEFQGEKAVGTVHTFQGGEKSVIVLSTRACGGRDGLSFFNERPNILNVAVSRAKELFILVGDLNRLKKGGRFAGQLVQHIEENGVILEYAPNAPLVPPLPAVETIHDCSHLSVLQQALKEASNELVVVCPWIRGKAAADFIDWAKPALARGVALTVAYGYDEDRDQDETMVNGLRELFAPYPKARLCQAQGRGTHQKLLLWDAKFAVIGSWNWLSHWYTKACNLQQVNPHVQVRRETSIKIADPVAVSKIREDLLQMLEGDAT